MSEILNNDVQFIEIQPAQWVGSTQATSGEIYPNNLKITCPACGHFSVFSFSSPQLHRRTLTILNGSKCAGCENLVRFVASYPSSTGSASPKRPFSFVCLTEFSRLHSPMPLDEVIPERLRNAISSTTDSFNSGNYVAAMNGGRRAMEGIFKLRLPQEQRKKKLYDLIEEASSDPSLSEPLKKLAHSIRDGGNLGAHFDEEIEPDEPTARRMLELLEYLVNYFYVLPSKVSDLESALES